MAVNEHQKIILSFLTKIVIWLYRPTRRFNCCFASIATMSPNVSLPISLLSFTRDAFTIFAGMSLDSQKKQWLLKELPRRLECLALMELEVLSVTRRSLFSSSFSRSCFLFLARSSLALLNLFLHVLHHKAFLSLRLRSIPWPWFTSSTFKCPETHPSSWNSSSF